MSIEFAKMAYPYPYIPAEKRRSILPAHNICSVSPASDPSDDFITGSGPLRVQASGRPYTEEISCTLETLYEPLWAKTPLPPDLRPVLPRIRELLLQGKPEETDALLDEAQKKAGFDKYMDFGNKILYPTGSPRLHTTRFAQYEHGSAADVLRGFASAAPERISPAIRLTVCPI